MGHVGDRKVLSCENLARDFGAAAKPAREAVGALYAALVGAGNPAVETSEERWRAQIGDLYGPAIDRPGGVVRSLARLYRLPADEIEPSALLLAAQTYYAMLVKLLVWQVVAERRHLDSPAERIAASRGGRLRRELEPWEAGDGPAAASLPPLFEQDPYSWYLAAWTEPIQQWIRTLAAEIQQYDPGRPGQCTSGARDLFKDLYQALFPKAFRHVLGQYYTPDWLAEHVLDEVGYSGQPGKRLLDPACGSGTFLVAAIQRIRAGEDERADAGCAAADLRARIVASVVGFELDLLAAGTARANYLLAISDLLPWAGRVCVPVYVQDSIVQAEVAGRLPGPSFDYVVGNPPWIAWDHLPQWYREVTKPLWRRYGLFSLSGTAGRHGGGKKDLSMLMLYAAADRYVKGGGRLGLVMTQTPFQSKEAGDGFRRFRLGDAGAWLRVLKVHDMADFQPFPGAANWTSTVIIEKGPPTVYPVPYVKWSLDPRAQSDPHSPSLRFRCSQCEAGPIDPQRPNSPWLVRPLGLRSLVGRLVGPSEYRAHLGANSGGANGVYWVSLVGPAQEGVRIRNLAAKGKRGVETVEQIVERELVYPLLRWGDVARYRAVPSAHVLLTQDVTSRRGIDEATFSRKYPLMHRYFRRFRAVLERRAAYRRYQRESPFWSMYDVGPYTLAPIKVIWRRMDRQINAAVTQLIDNPWLGTRPVVPQETCVLIPAAAVEEAHYLCALLNSRLVNFLVRAHSVRRGKGFGTPSILDFLRLRRFDPHDDRHMELSVCSRRAHDRAQNREDWGELQQRMDQLAAQLWGLTPSELEAIEGE